MIVVVVVVVVVAVVIVVVAPGRGRGCGRGRALVSMLWRCLFVFVQRCDADGQMQLISDSCTRCDAMLRVNADGHRPLPALLSVWIVHESRWPKQLDGHPWLVQRRLQFAGSCLRHGRACCRLIGLWCRRLWRRR